LPSLAGIDLRLVEPFDDGPFEVKKYSSETDRLSDRNGLFASITDCNSYLDRIKNAFSGNIPIDQWQFVPEASTLRRCSV